MTVADPTSDRIDLPAEAAMSIDVEDWFQVQNLAGAIPRDSWETRERRVVANTDRMLGMMAEAGARSTCFVLGWVAERHPDLVRRIAAAGHEVASHGYGHELIYEIGPERFREDIRRAKGILEGITGTRVLGYRAPNFSITDWALDVLAEEGHAYDSSSFPVVAHDRYGRGLREFVAHRRPRHPLGWRGVVPTVPVPGLPVGRAAHHRLGQAVRVLHPSVGDRPGTAPSPVREAHARAAPLHEPCGLRPTLGQAVAVKALVHDQRVARTRTTVVLSASGGEPLHLRRRLAPDRLPAVARR
jgi:peptidoglycan/xylan/chitin deacetylase (PgdA/CDA1 family)